LSGLRVFSRATAWNIDECGDHEHTPPRTPEPVARQHSHNAPRLSLDQFNETD